MDKETLSNYGWITVVFEITHNWGVPKCGWKEKPRITGKPGSLGKGQVEMFLIFEAVFFCFGRANPQNALSTF